VAQIAPDIFFASISELNAKLRAKEFSCHELTQAFCDRIEKIGPRYNALALSLRKQALSKAKDVDRELKRDRTRGALQGIPYGVKDLLAVKKQPTTWGAKPYAAQVFDYDAHLVERLDKVGAILIAKLSMVELAGGGDYRTAAASLTGPGLNPWDRTHWSGAGHGRDRLGDYGLDSDTVGFLRRDRPAPDLWSGQPPRSDGAFVDARQAGADVPFRGRLRAGAARDRRGRHG
jgi:hypothetical protein